MIAGPLTQLSSLGTQNAYFNNSNSNTHSNYAVNIILENFVNNKVYVSHSKGDLMRPLYIKSDKKIEYVDYMIGSQRVNCIPLEFCNKLNNFETERDGHFMYKIPDFFKDIILIAVRYSPIYFHLKLQDNETSCQATLYCKYVYLNNVKRQECRVNTQKVIMNLI